MNISVKSEYALLAIFDLASLPPGEPSDRRYRAPPENPAKISGTDPGRAQAGRLRGIAARRRRRLPAGAARRTITVGEVLRFVEGKASAPPQRRRPPLPTCGSRWIRPSPASSTTPPSPSWCAPGRNRRPSSSPTGRSNWFSRTIHSASDALRWCGSTASPTAARPPCSPRSKAAIRPTREVPHRRVDDLGRGKARRAQAGQRTDRAHQRQHRHRAGLCRRRARLPGHADDARDHVDRAPQSAQGSGREAHPHRRRDGMGGSIARAEQMVAAEPNRYVLLQQFQNPANPDIHFKTTGPEIWDDTEGTIDVLVAGIGTGGTITGVSRYIKKEGRRYLSVGVEPQGSPVITQTLAGKPIAARSARDPGHRRGIHSGHAGSEDGRSRGTKYRRRSRSKWPGGWRAKKGFFAGSPAVRRWRSPCGWALPE